MEGFSASSKPDQMRLGMFRVVWPSIAPRWWMQHRVGGWENLVLVASRWSLSHLPSWPWVQNDWSRTTSRGQRCFSCLPQLLLTWHQQFHQPGNSPVHFASSCKPTSGVWCRCSLHRHPHPGMLFQFMEPLKDLKCPFCSVLLTLICLYWSFLSPAGWCFGIFSLELQSPLFYLFI